MDATQQSPQHAPESAQPPTLQDRARAAQQGVTRVLSGRMPSTPEQELRDLADVVASLDEPGWDRYGARGPVALLEERLAGLLGKPAVAVFPSGVMAQQAMLRVWCDREGSRRVALPGLSHLLHHEADGPRLLHGFDFELLTDGAKVPLAEDLASVRGRLGAVLLELPLRDAGFLLPSWDELTSFSRACRAREIPLHLDGARIWESVPHLGHTPAEIAALADSVYVSFYKGLGGLAGAALAGPEEQIAEARTWRQRMGGTLFTVLPFAVAALRGLETEPDRMAAYHSRAQELAERMVAHGIRVSPASPHTNAFRIHVEGDADTLNERLVAVMEQDRVALTPMWSAADVPGWCWTEFAVGQAAMEWDLDEAVDQLKRVLLG